MGNTATAKKGNEQESGKHQENQPAKLVSHPTLSVVQRAIDYNVKSVEQPLAIVVQRLADSNITVICAAEKNHL